MSTSFNALDLSDLANLYGAPPENSVKKELSQLNDAYRLWLEQSPFLLIASSDGQQGDCSPRVMRRVVCFVFWMIGISRSDRLLCYVEQVLC